MKREIMLCTAILAVSCIFVSCASENTVTEHPDSGNKGFKYPISYTEELKKAEANIEIANAVVTVTVEPTVTVTPTPELVEEIVEEVVVEAVVPVEEEVVLVEEIVEEVYDSCYEESVEYGNYYEDVYDVPQEQNIGMTYLGNYYTTHYSAEGCGNNIGAAEVEGGMQEGVSVAMPDYWMLGHWIYIEGYGEFRVDDISPDGICDIFHWYEADAVGADYREVWLIS